MGVFANLLRKALQVLNYPDSNLLLFFLNKLLSLLIAKCLCSIPDDKGAHSQAELLVPTEDCWTSIGKPHLFSLPGGPCSSHVL